MWLKLFEIVSGRGGKEPAPPQPGRSVEPGTKRLQPVNVPVDKRNAGLAVY